MKHLLIVSWAILSTGLLYSQPLPDWSSSLTSGFDWYIHDKPMLKLDNSGGLILVGNTDTGTNGRDMLIVKYSSSGTIIWQQYFNGINNSDDVANDFEIDLHDNVIVTGSTRIDSADTDCITLKYSSNGTLLWTSTFNGIPNREDAAQAISLDHSGSSFITGYSSIDTLNHHQLYASRIDSSGNIIWNYVYGSDSLGVYHGERIKSHDNQISILGSYVSYNTFTNKFLVIRLDSNGTEIFANEGVMNRPASVFYLDQFQNSYLGFGGWERFKTVKVNSSGIVAWSDTIGTNLPPNVTADQVRGIVVDSLQNVYVTGRHNGDDYGGPTSSNADIVTVKYDSIGNRSWVSRYEYQSNNAADIGNVIALDENLNVYVAGQSGVTLADYDYLVLKYDNNGNQIGSIRYNDMSGGDDVITSMVVSQDSSIYVTGLTFENSLSNTTTQKYSTVSGVGILESQAQAVSLNSFPNPFNTLTTIQFSNPNNQRFLFELTDLTGKLFLEMETTFDVIEISANNLETGIYFFTISSKSIHYTGKVIRTE